MFALQEKTRLADELSAEQQRSEDLSQEIFRLRANDSVASVAVKLAQNHTSNGTVPEAVDVSADKQTNKHSALPIILTF